MGGNVAFLNKKDIETVLRWYMVAKGEGFTDDEDERIAHNLEFILKEVKETEERVFTKLYSIDCEYNDREDLKYGGPRTVGFDFFIDSMIPEEEVRSKLTELLKKYGRPLMEIRVGAEDTPILLKNLWTWDRIEKEIEKGY